VTRGVGRCRAAARHHSPRGRRAGVAGVIPELAAKWKAGNHEPFKAVSTIVPGAEPTRSVRHSGNNRGECRVKVEAPRRGDGAADIDADGQKPGFG
jgi:hypothetical protein